MSGAVPPEGLPPPERSAEEIRTAAERILQRPEFGDQRSLYERALAWLSERLADVLAALTGGGRGALLAWAILAAALAAVGYLLWRIVRDGGIAARTARPPGPHVAVSDGRRSAAQWRQAADEHASAGRWPDAVRCRWRAVVAHLVERGRIDDVDGSTAGDHRAQVATRVAEVAPAFEEATAVFEAAWYGGAEVGPDDHQRLLAAERAIEEATAVGGR